MPPTTALLQAIITGIATGSMIALGAIGLSMVYSIAEVPNFAHGDLHAQGEDAIHFYTDKTVYIERWPDA